MKEKDIKKIIEKSKVKTSLDFTDKLMAEVENDTPQQVTIKFWSLNQIAIGFVLVAVISGFLVFKVSDIPLFNGSIAIPFIWSLILLLGLNYILSLNAYRPLYWQHHKFRIDHLENRNA